MRKIYYATRDFNDAGTERSFTAGQPVSVNAGAIANYAAAGLVTDKKPVAKRTVVETSEPADPAG